MTDTDVSRYKERHREREHQSPALIGPGEKLRQVYVELAILGQSDQLFLLFGVSQ